MKHKIDYNALIEETLTASGFDSTTTSQEGATFTYYKTTGRGTRTFSHIVDRKRNVDFWKHFPNGGATIPSKVKHYATLSSAYTGIRKALNII